MTLNTEPQHNAQYPQCLNQPNFNIPARNVMILRRIFPGLQHYGLFSSSLPKAWLRTAMMKPQPLKSWQWHTIRSELMSASNGCSKPQMIGSGPMCPGPSGDVILHHLKSKKVLPDLVPKQCQPTLWNFSRSSSTSVCSALDSQTVAITTRERHQVKGQVVCSSLQHCWEILRSTTVTFFK